MMKPRAQIKQFNAAMRQRGVVLIITLIVLVAMTLAAVALIRASDTTNMIAGNMSFQQAATHAADSGVQIAATWLKNNPALLNTNSAGAPVFYVANGLNVNNAPDLSTTPPQTWHQFWNATLVNRALKVIDDDPNTRNTVWYVIDRMCANSGPPVGGANCVESPVLTSVPGNGEEAGGKQLEAPSGVYYRVTVRVDGPRNTVSYIQTFLSL